MNLQELIEKFQLNQTEQTILTFLFHHPDCKNMSIRQVAKECFTSTATISHLAKKLKLSGYSELVFQISKLNLDNQSFNLENTHLTQDDLLQFSSLLTKHKDDPIMILSSGFSQNIANYMNESFNLHQYRCMTNSHLELIYNQHLNSGLLIFISHSGETKRLIELGKMAREKNIDIISFVGNKQSPIAQLSTLTISTDSYNPFSFSQIKPQFFFGKALIQFEILICHLLDPR